MGHSVPSCDVAFRDSSIRSTSGEMRFCDSEFQAWQHGVSPTDPSHMHTTHTAAIHGSLRLTSRDSAVRLHLESCHWLTVRLLYYDCGLHAHVHNHHQGLLRIRDVLAALVLEHP